MIITMIIVIITIMVIISQHTTLLAIYHSWLGVIIGSDNALCATCYPSMYIFLLCFISLFLTRVYEGVPYQTLSWSGLCVFVQGVINFHISMFSLMVALSISTPMSKLLYCCYRVSFVKYLTLIFWQNLIVNVIHMCTKNEWMWYLTDEVPKSFNENHLLHMIKWTSPET